MGKKGIFLCVRASCVCIRTTGWSCVPGIMALASCICWASMAMFFCWMRLFLPLISSWVFRWGGGCRYLQFSLEQRPWLDKRGVVGRWRQGGRRTGRMETWKGDLRDIVSFNGSLMERSNELSAQVAALRFGRRSTNIAGHPGLPMALWPCYPFLSKSRSETSLLQEQKQSFPSAAAKIL